jgi:hypothetical protein
MAWSTPADGSVDAATAIHRVLDRLTDYDYTLLSARGWALHPRACRGGRRYSVSALRAASPHMWAKPRDVSDMNQTSSLLVNAGRCWLVASCLNELVCQSFRIGEHHFVASWHLQESVQAESARHQGVPDPFR